jgi:hypothetical protein
MNCFRRPILSMVFWFAIILLLAILVGCDRPKQKAQILCSTNESQLHLGDGWLQLAEADRHRVARLAGMGRVEIEYRPGSLKCQVLYGEGITEIESSGLWYWRSKRAKT